MTVKFSNRFLYSPFTLIHNKPKPLSLDSRLETYPKTLLLLVCILGRVCVFDTKVLDNVLSTLPVLLDTDMLLFVKLLLLELGVLCWFWLELLLFTGLLFSFKFTFRLLAFKEFAMDVTTVVAWARLLVSELLVLEPRLSFWLDFGSGNTLVFSYF